MALDPEKLRVLAEKADSLSRRFDEFVARRKVNAADDDEDDPDEDECFDPNEPLTPSRPWYGDNEERDELRQGSLSKRG
jgi:hypothetical protein